MTARTPWHRSTRAIRSACALACVFLATAAVAAEHRGRVFFSGFPVPGATVTATQGTRTFNTVSDAQGVYDFPDLPDGTWKIEVSMTGFASTSLNVAVAPSLPTATWELKMLPLEQMMAQTKVIKAGPIVAANSPAAPKPDAPKSAEAEAPRPPEEPAQSNDGFLVNGSVNNAATSQFSLSQAFGNQRKGSKGLYTGGLALILDNSVLDARPYSLSGLETTKSAYNHVTAVATFGGPIRIPHLMPRGPNFFAAYQWTRDRVATAQSALVPTLAQRAGNLATGIVPVTPQAQALLALYPLPNLVGNSNYNYQVPVLNSEHQDALQTRLDKGITRRDQLYGGFAFQSTREDDTNVFGFRDATGVLGINANINWNRHIRHSLYSTLSYRFSRLRTEVAPFFANRSNISGLAGINGNSQDPANWGPPTLIFSSGIAALTDGQSAFNRNRTEGLSASLQWYHGHHNVTYGGDFRRQEFNQLSQPNPRGSFTFNGAATGSDFSGFLAGKPDTAAIAFGNADKYFRQSVYDAYVTDDWRLRPDLTLNLGIRWEYGAPLTELKNRLVNLDVAPGFKAVAPVLASLPHGPLSGQSFPSSLVRPDKRAFQPRLGVSWRPIPGSSVVVRAGYGIYADTSIYLRNASRMAVQPPLARNLSVSNSLLCPLTLSSGLAQTQCDADTFGVDPDFKVGYAQTWQLAVQRDLPFALQMTATYLGVKGAHGVQQFLPNTYPFGGVNPCPTCPSGFFYRTTDGTSIRNAGSLQLRRRLRSGFTATATYTFSKSLDDDATLGGQGPLAGGAITQSGGNSQPAQNWLDLHAERGLSTFDQRHLLIGSVQYTSGTGLGGGALLGGWRGRALKEWTVEAQVNAGSGLPESPLYLATVPGTGETGILRPNRTAAPLYSQTGGRFLNPAAFAAPAAGQFGNAGRNSITGPGTFTFNSSFSRTFRLDKKYNLDVRVDAANLLNHVVYTSYNTSINPTGSNPLFGIPIAANPMRSLQTTARLRF